MPKNIDAWSEILKDLPQSYRKWFEEERKYLQNRINSGSRVLEVGCGDGRSIFDILPKTKNIVGIDHDVKAVNSAKNNFSNIHSIKIMKAAAEDLPFESEEFDYVVCMTTFANFADKKFLILEEIKRVLKKDGKFIMSVFSEDAFDERIKLYKKLGIIKEIRGTTVVLNFDNDFSDNISEQFTEKELRNIFKRAKLKVVDITRINIAYLCTLSK